MNNQPMKPAIILAVDDTPTNLRILLDYLKELGFKTLIATSGERAIQQLELVLPDLILLDVMMPGLDGFATCRQIKQNPTTKDIPVIFMTALSETVDKVKGFEAGAVDYVTKPFQQEEVLARITTHLTMQRQKRELAELNGTKDKFFSIIAHDMKGAFSSLLGFSSLLATSIQHYNPTEIQEIAQMLNDSAQNTFKLLENLLSWARIQSGRIEFQPRELNLSQLVKDNVELLCENANQKGLNIINSIEPATLVYADENMVNTILRNLIANGIKFSQAGGEIKIAQKIVEEFVEISVADTGIGIPAPYVQHLFRIDKTFTRAGTADEKGTGLGLILCKEFVQKNGGQITVESVEGQGTTFRFTLPAVL